jgi:hypothetical protein
LLALLATHHILHVSRIRVNDILFALGCGTEEVMDKKIFINSLMDLKYLYMQIKFQYLMLTVHCMGKLSSPTVYCI